MVLAYGAHLVTQVLEGLTGPTADAAPPPYFTSEFAMLSIAARKRLLRTEAEKRRDIAAARGDIGIRLVEIFKQHVRAPRGIAISGYYPIRSEANVLPLLNKLRDQGFDIALPVIEKRNAPLIFRRWDETTELRNGAFGIPEPAPDAIAIHPDIILTPLLAFDLLGNRLGYGGGFYDLSIRSIRKIQPVCALGIAYALQEVPVVPCNEDDTVLDGILTEQGIVRPESEKS